ncbi:MAG: lamin tail domain-containing protein [Hyphomicrobiales bacterium]
MARTWGRIVWFLVLAALASLLFRLVPPARAQIATDLELSEILAGPSRDWDGDGVYNSRQDEWVEVRNATGASIDLSAYRIADADSTIRYELSGFLAPGTVLVVMGSDAENQQRALGRTVTGLSLNNAGDTVLLFRVGASDTTVVDAHAYGTIEGASDRSVGRLDPTGAWTLFDGLNKYSGSGEPQGTGCAPTPGAVNGCTTAVTNTTWGKIKRLYLEGH